MPLFVYKGRDKDGRLHAGQRNAVDATALSSDLLKEGVFPIAITVKQSTFSLRDKLAQLMQSRTQQLEELTNFIRQMQLLYQANVPMVSAIRQLATNTPNKRLAQALRGISDSLEKGESLSSAMRHYPTLFSPLMISIIQIGENSGKLNESFGHLHHYLEFEMKSFKQIKTAFRYPMFVITSVIISIFILNIFVIPSFARFYSSAKVALPWQTQLLIGSSNFIVHHGLALAIFFIACVAAFIRYIRTEKGRYKWDRLITKIPYFGLLIKRVNLIRFADALAITLAAGIPIHQGLTFVRQVIENRYLAQQVADMQEQIERGVSLSRAIVKMDLFSPLELQILGVGEKNGELSPALNYIASYHTQEIEFDLKRVNDVIGPILVAIMGGLILIIALGVYLPIWNMVNVVH